MLTDNAWMTVRQAPYEMVDTYVSGLLDIIAANRGRTLPAHRRQLRLIWRDRALIKPSLLRRVAAVRQHRLQ